MRTTMIRRPARHFTDDFKHQMVQLYQSGKKQCDIIREYDLTRSVLSRWIKEATTTGSFRKKDNRTPSENELMGLKKELKRLQMENDILKQATLIMGRK